MPDIQPRSLASRLLADEDRERRPVEDVVVADAAVEEKDAVVVHVDRRLDVVVARGVTADADEPHRRPGSGSEGQENEVKWVPAAVRFAGSYTETVESITS